ncbi:probable glutathione peroxidase 2 [Sipha flava]|uniref:Phospholipid hydroperoxide glutathione peroxidase n=1 Tax=Sipha flava TaxID=143950 RepID=A0A2S2QDM3_9HEMI|nr:probable glutathione peroxidase 2 [Sipha flava]XP_025410864.1 probable glutathione peroxidase 2 [Sipha flava]XP_025410865.1 probable glutathione peroxidase 2 [Sipha flava]XP_025410866.1 probable glutathione peroxidase 2 [Sipha flava]
MKAINIFLLKLAILLTLKICNCEEVYDFSYHPEPKSIYEFSVKDDQGNNVSLSKYRGYVLVLSDVAIRPPVEFIYIKQLNILQEKYYDEGLRVLCFPTDQLYAVVPPYPVNATEFRNKYHLKFEIFGSLNINNGLRHSAHPLWLWLQRSQEGFLINAIKYNYTKFVIDRYGLPTDRFSIFASLQDMENAVLRHLRD